MAATAGVQVEGLGTLVRALKALDKEAPKELRAGLKNAVAIVASAAKPLAQRKTGALQSSIKAASRGNTALVVAKVPYANLLHWGGNVPSRGSSSTRPKRHFAGKPFVVEAFDEKSDAVVEKVYDQIEAVAVRHGFH